MMLHQGIRNQLACFVLLLSSVDTQAETMRETHKNFYRDVEVSAAGGPNWLNTHDTEVVISPFETDSTHVGSISNDGTWKVGIGYYLFDDRLASRSFFDHLLLELNVYQISATINGIEWQYKQRSFNNYNFAAPISSTRLMVDIKPNLFTWNRLSPYPIVGVGAAWNKASYNETIANIGIDPDTTLLLPNSTTNQFAWDLGAGARFAFTNHISITAEYVYAFLGHGAPANEPANGVNLSYPPRFSFQTQSLLFGLSLIL